MRKKKQDQDPDGPPSYEDEITYRVTLPHVIGKGLTEIIAKARVEAALALGTRPENIYIISNSPPAIVATARFGDDTPILWRSAVTCGVVPPELQLG